MSDQLSLLPAELIHQILDEIPTFDILTHVSFLNKRLRTISLHYHRFRFDLTRSFSKKRQFEQHCAQLVHLSSQVVSLTLANDDDATMPAKIACFFSQSVFTNMSFSNLRVLSLSHVDHSVWQSFKARRSSFVALTSISISCVQDEEPVTRLFISTILNELLFFSSALDHLALRAFNDPPQWITIDPRRTLTTSAVKRVTLDNIQMDWRSLLSVTPRLQSFTSTVNCISLIYLIQLSPPVHLQRLSITVDNILLATIERLLSSTKSLTHFTLIAKNIDEKWADGGQWARLLPTVTVFKFHFTFTEYVLGRKPLDLQSFETSFWLVEKKWYVTLDSGIQWGHALLYSNPYCLDWYPFHEMMGTFVTASTSPEPTSFLRVKQLETADWLPSNDILLHRCTHVNDLEVSASSLDYSLSWRYVFAQLNTAIITSLTINTTMIGSSTDAVVQWMCSLPSVKTLRLSVGILKMLLGYHWPRITHLTTTWGSDRLPKRMDEQQVDSLCRSFTHLQQLNFNRSFIDNVSQLLNSMMTSLTHVHIDHGYPITANDDRFISQQWLERNTKLRNFHYSCDASNRVDLWL